MASPRTRAASRDVDRLGGRGEVAARGVLVREGDAVDACGGRRLNPAGVVLDRDGVAGVLAELLEGIGVGGWVRLRARTESTVDDEVERVGVEVRLQRRQQCVDVVLGRGGDGPSF